nr:hypothetical protein [Tanacetum cinerariifolium]
MPASNQQTLTESGANDRHSILEKWNYIPWESRFRRFLYNKLEDGERMWCSIEKGPYERPLITNPDDDKDKILKPLRYLNQKRENRKWLNEAVDEGPYEFKIFTPSETKAPRMQKEEDLRGDYLKHYEAEIEAMNLILISIPNDIYNSVDACTTAKTMWQRVKCLMQGTVKNKVDGETRFNKEFD